ncbi:MAG: hypothetical protein AB8E15_10915 [Bdellovibrionales bacterium]
MSICNLFGFLFCLFSSSLFANEIRPPADMMKPAKIKLIAELLNEHSRVSILFQKCDSMKVSSCGTSNTLSVGSAHEVPSGFYMFYFDGNFYSSQPIYLAPGELKEVRLNKVVLSFDSKFEFRRNNIQVLRKVSDNPNGYLFRALKTSIARHGTSLLRDPNQLHIRLFDDNGEDVSGENFCPALIEGRAEQLQLDSYLEFKSRLVWRNNSKDRIRSICDSFMKEDIESVFNLMFSHRDGRWFRKYFALHYSADNSIVFVDVLEADASDGIYLRKFWTSFVDGNKLEFHLYSFPEKLSLLVTWDRVEHKRVFEVRPTDLNRRIEFSFAESSTSVKLIANFLPDPKSTYSIFECDEPTVESCSIFKRQAEFNEEEKVHPSYYIFKYGDIYWPSEPILINSEGLEYELPELRLEPGEVDLRVSIEVNRDSALSRDNLELKYRIANSYRQYIFPFLNRNGPDWYVDEKSPRITENNFCEMYGKNQLTNLIEKGDFLSPESRKLSEDSISLFRDYCSMRLMGKVNYYELFVSTVLDLPSERFFTFDADLSFVTTRFLEPYTYLNKYMEVGATPSTVSLFPGHYQVRFRSSIENRIVPIEIN